MKKVIIIILSLSVLLLSFLPLTSSAFILNHRVYCYGLQQCQGAKNQALNKCKKDSQGDFYLVKKMRACSREHGYTK